MHENTALILKYVGISEGGYVNDPDDPGGETNHGITQKTLTAYDTARGRPVRSVKHLTKDEADTIYVSQYFTPVQSYILPSGIDYMVVDYAIHSGVKRSVQDLQRCVGFTGADVDGVMGNVTLAAVEKATATKPDTLALIEHYAEMRMEFMRGLKGWKKYKNGWTTRVIGAKPGVQNGDIGVADRAWRMNYTPLDAAPAPTASVPGKALERDTRGSAVLDKVMQDPVAVAGAAAPLLAPLANSLPVQIALAVCIVALVAWALMRALRRQA